MVNLTVSIDEEVLRDARIEALHRKTSVNRMVTEFLTEIAGRREKQVEAIRRIRELMQSEGVQIDPTSYTRDELHERR